MNLLSPYFLIGLGLGILASSAVTLIQVATAKELPSRRNGRRTALASAVTAVLIIAVGLLLTL